MASEGTRQWKTPAAAPPRTINVQKFAASRAAELESLHSVVSSRLNGDFRSRRDKRRRTTGFDNKAANRRRKRRRIGETAKEKNGGGEGEEKKLPRRVRRRIELKKNPEAGFVTCGDGTRRLRTHLWHAKRFTMSKLWGFYLPLGLHGKGKGSRALLKWYKQGTVVHDASYCSAVHLEGPEDAVLSVLRTVLEPSQLGHSVDCSTAGQSRCVLCGDIYGSSILHHDGVLPLKAICPVTYMWRPSHPQDGSVAEESSNNDEDAKKFHVRVRQLWIWMHPSAFSEGYDALKTACQKLGDTGDYVKCLSLEGQLGKIEVMGLKAFSLLKKILHPVNSSSEHDWRLKKCSVTSVTEDGDGCTINEPQILLEEESFSFSAILPLLVSDPRLVSENSITAVHQADIGSDQDKQGVQTDKTEELISTDSSNCKDDITFSECKCVWDAADGGICAPVEESVLCTEKYHRRLSAFCLKDAKLGTVSEVQGSRLCPIMLMRNTNKTGSLKGWSIILPLNWVKAFWMPLVSNGAHAIGLREKRWIACDAGLPCFPSDFPDCNAYYSLKATESAASDQKIERRPPAKRPFKVPVIPPWNIIPVSVDTVASSPVDSPMEVAVARTLKTPNLFSSVDCVKRLLLNPDYSETQISQSSERETLTCQQHNKLCYLRLLIHAFKEGSFEEGAVICAPSLSDIALLRSGSENNESKLQVPQSVLASNNWEFELPEDCTASESFRQPIGFITTGFVRGSKKPVAVGMGEATRLASLRQEQRSQVSGIRKRREIFVLVRNLRSCAYRLALATIVLGSDEGEDLQFL